jgi:hypothetical protein
MLRRLAIRLGHHPTMHDVVCYCRFGYHYTQKVCSDVQVVSNVFTDETGRWVAAFITLTFLTNLFSSGLLAYRIWIIEREASTIRARKGIMPIVRMLVDAAILYFVSNCAAIICFARSNNGLYVIGDLINPIISIAFYMVFIRIAINKDTQEFLSAVYVGAGESRDRPKDPTALSYAVFAA